jgi:polyferredoxin
LKSAIISKRRIIQALIGGLLIVLYFYFKVPLTYILVVGVLSGVIFGKVFCRWMCPLGFIMELMLGSIDSGSKQLQLYNYHKFGCPIAWISGFLNRFSLFKIKRDTKLCIDCGICDKECYIATLNQKFSLYKKDKKNPAQHYSCSKCLSCVDKCPTKSLRYKI